MSKLLLLSHGNLAKEMMKTAELILGEFSGVEAISLLYGNDLTEYKNNIIKVVKSAKEDGLLIITDLFGGSPFMISSQVYSEFNNEVDVDVVTGMNLGMVIQLISMKANKTVDELRKIAVTAGNDGIVDLKSKMN